MTASERHKLREAIDRERRRQLALARVKQVRRRLPEPATHRERATADNEARLERDRRWRAEIIGSVWDWEAS